MSNHYSRPLRLGNDRMVIRSIGAGLIRGCMVSIHGWLRERVDEAACILIGYPRYSRKSEILWRYLPPYYKSFIEQACSVKMAGYWPRSFVRYLLAITPPPPSHLDHNPISYPESSGSLVSGLVAGRDSGIMD